MLQICRIGHRSCDIGTEVVEATFCEIHYREVSDKLLAIKEDAVVIPTDSLNDYLKEHYGPLDCGSDSKNGGSMK